MASKLHPPTIVNGLYEKLLHNDLLPVFLRGENGEKLFQLIVFSWFIIIVLVIITYINSRHLKRIPGRFQAAMEIIIEKLTGLLESLIGYGGKKYLGLLGTIFIFIFCLNLLGLIPGMISPTANWNCTVALSLVTILFVQSYGIKENGFLGYLKHMSGSPKGIAMWILVPMMFPLHLLGEAVKPLSLSLRLYGNISGEDTIIMAIVNIIQSPPLAWLPIPSFIGLILMMGFALFTSFLQAFIFTALSCIYIMVMKAHSE
ncbi:MAG: F0F1 ATP synthase subunit A [Planctomycetota bacterium]